MPGLSPGWPLEPGGNIGPREMVVTPLSAGYRTRLTGLPGPDKAEAKLFIHPDGVTVGVRQTLSIYTARSWSGGTWPQDQDALLAVCPDLPSLAHLRNTGYRPATIALYYHTLRLFLDFLGLRLQVELRKPQVLPPYHDSGDMERLLRQASIGLPRQSGEIRCRNASIITVMMDTGLRLGELLSLRVGDVDFNKGVLVVRMAKGQKQRAVPLTTRAILALRDQAKGKGAQQRVFHGVNRRNT